VFGQRRSTPLRRKPQRQQADRSGGLQRELPGKGFLAKFFAPSGNQCKSARGILFHVGNSPPLPSKKRDTGNAHAFPNFVMPRIHPCPVGEWIGKPGTTPWTQPCCFQPDPPVQAGRAGFQRTIRIWRQAAVWSYVYSTKRNHKLPLV